MKNKFCWGLHNFWLLFLMSLNLGLRIAHSVIAYIYLPTSSAPLTTITESYRFALQGDITVSELIKNDPEVKTIYKWFNNRENSSENPELSDAHRQILVNRIIITQLEKSPNNSYVFYRSFDPLIITINLELVCKKLCFVEFDEQLS